MTLAAAGRCVIAAVLTLASNTAATDTPALAEAREAARQAAATLGRDLKSRLVAGLESGGPMTALHVCKASAPAIAAAISTRGLDVGRTALRVRNPANAPDAWERVQLEAFSAAIASGKPSADLEAETVIEVADGQVLRWMAPIPMAEKPCGSCHGSSIDPSLGKAIRALYPGDEAVGFKPGELRGAFTVDVPLAAAPAR